MSNRDCAVRQASLHRAILRFHFIAKLRVLNRGKLWAQGSDSLSEAHVDGALGAALGEN